MRRSLIAATAGAFFLLGTASAFSADAMTDGTYFTDDFGNNNCGLLTVSKGKPSRYQYGPCNGSKNGLASVSYSRNGLGYRGKTVYIQVARFRISSIADTRISGHWTLGNFNRSLKFDRQ